MRKEKEFSIHYHRSTRAWIGINFPESERVSIRKAPYGRSLLIPVKFNGVDSPNRLTQLSNEPRCHGTHSNSSRADRYPWTCVREREGVSSKTLSKERERERVYVPALTFVNQSSMLPG